MREVLAGKIQISRLLPQEAGDVPGMMTVVPKDGEMADEVSDQAYAALKLAQLEDKGSLPAIVSLLQKATDSDKKVLEKAKHLKRGQVDS